MFQSLERFRKNLELQYSSMNNSISANTTTNNNDKVIIEENDSSIMIETRGGVVEFPSSSRNNNNKNNSNMLLFSLSPTSQLPSSNMLNTNKNEHNHNKDEYRLPFHSEEYDIEDDGNSQPGADGYYRDTGSYTNRFLPPPIMEVNINSNNNNNNNNHHNGSIVNNTSVEYRSTIIDEIREQCSNDNERHLIHHHHPNVHFELDHHQQRKQQSRVIYYDDNNSVNNHDNGSIFGAAAGGNNILTPPIGVVVNASLIDDYYYIDDVDVVETGNNNRSVVSPSSSYASSRHPYHKYRHNNNSGLSSPMNSNNEEKFVAAMKKIQSNLKGTNHGNDYNDDVSGVVKNKQTTSSSMTKLRSSLRSPDSVSTNNNNNSSYKKLKFVSDDISQYNTSTGGVKEQKTISSPVNMIKLPSGNLRSNMNHYGNVGNDDDGVSSNIIIPSYQNPNFLSDDSQYNDGVSSNNFLFTSHQKPNFRSEDNSQYSSTVAGGGVKPHGTTSLSVPMNQLRSNIRSVNDDSRDDVRDDYDDDGISSKVVISHHQKRNFRSDDTATTADGVIKHATSMSVTGVVVPASLVIEKTKKKHHVSAYDTTTSEVNHHQNQYYFHTDGNDEWNAKTPATKIGGGDHYSSYTPSSSIIVSHRQEGVIPKFTRGNHYKDPDDRTTEMSQNNHIIISDHLKNQFHHDNKMYQPNMIGDTSTVGVIVGSTYFGKVDSTMDIESVHNGGINDGDTIELSRLRSITTTAVTTVPNNDKNITKIIEPYSSNDKEKKKIPFPTLIVPHNHSRTSPHHKFSSSISLPSSKGLGDYEKKYKNNHYTKNDIQSAKVSVANYYNPKVPPTLIVQHNHTSTPKAIHHQKFSSTISLPSSTSTTLQNSENYRIQKHNSRSTMMKSMLSEDTGNDEEQLSNKGPLGLSGKVLVNHISNEVNHSHPPVVVVPAVYNDTGNHSNDHYTHNKNKSNQRLTSHNETIDVKIPPTISNTSNTLLPSRIVVPGKDINNRISPNSTTSNNVNAYGTDRSSPFFHNTSPKNRRTIVNNEIFASSPFNYDHHNTGIDNIESTGDVEVDTVVTQIMKLQPNQALKLKAFLSFVDDSNKDETNHEQGKTSNQAKNSNHSQASITSHERKLLSLNPSQIQKLEKLSKQSIVHNILSEKSQFVLHQVPEAKSFQDDDMQVLPPLHPHPHHDRRHHDYYDTASYTNTFRDADHQNKVIDYRGTVLDVTQNQDRPTIPQTIPMINYIDSVAHTNDKKNHPVDSEDQNSIVINQFSMIPQASLPFDDARSRVTYQSSKRTKARGDSPTGAYTINSHINMDYDDVINEHDDNDYDDDIITIVQSVLGGDLEPNMESPLAISRNDIGPIDYHENATFITNDDATFIPKDDTGILEHDENGTIDKDDTGVIPSKESTTSWNKNEPIIVIDVSTFPNEEAMDANWSQEMAANKVKPGNAEKHVELFELSSHQDENSRQQSMSKSERKSRVDSSSMSVAFTIVPLDTSIVNELTGEGMGAEATYPKTIADYTHVVDEELSIHSKKPVNSDKIVLKSGESHPDTEPPKSIEPSHVDNPNNKGIPEVYVERNELYPPSGDLPIVLAHSIIEDSLSNASWPKHIGNKSYGDDMPVSHHTPTPNPTTPLRADCHNHQRQILKVVGIPVQRTLDALSENFSLDGTMDQQRFDTNLFENDTVRQIKVTADVNDNEKNASNSLLESRHELYTNNEVVHESASANQLTTEFTHSQVSPSKANNHVPRKQGLDPIAAKAPSPVVGAPTPKSRRTYSNKGAPQEDAFKTYDRAGNEVIKTIDTSQHSSVIQPRKSKERQKVLHQTRQPPPDSPCINLTRSIISNVRNNDSTIKATEQSSMASQNESTSSFRNESSSTSPESVLASDPLFETMLSAKSNRTTPPITGLMFEEQQRAYEVDGTDQKPIPTNNAKGAMNPAEAQKLAKEALEKSNAKDALRDLRRRASSTSAPSISQNPSIISRSSLIIVNQGEAQRGVSSSANISSVNQHHGAAIQSTTNNNEANARKHDEGRAESDSTQLSMHQLDNASYQRRQFLSSYSSQSMGVTTPTSQQQQHDGSVGSFRRQPAASSSKASSRVTKSIHSRQHYKEERTSISINDDDSGTVISYNTAPLPSTRYARFHDLTSSRRGDVILSSDPPTEDRRDIVSNINANNNHDELPTGSDRKLAATTKSTIHSHEKDETKRHDPEEALLSSKVIMGENNSDVVRKRSSDSRVNKIRQKGKEIRSRRRDSSIQRMGALTISISTSSICNNHNNNCVTKNKDLKGGDQNQEEIENSETDAVEVVLAA